MPPSDAGEEVRLRRPFEGSALESFELVAKCKLRACPVDLDVHVTAGRGARSFYLGARECHLLLRVVLRLHGIPQWLRRERPATLVLFDYHKGVLGEL